MLPLPASLCQELLEVINDRMVRIACVAKQVPQVPDDLFEFDRLLKCYVGSLPCLTVNKAPSKKLSTQQITSAMKKVEGTSKGAATDVAWVTHPEPTGNSDGCRGLMRICKTSN